MICNYLLQNHEAKTSSLTALICGRCSLMDEHGGRTQSQRNEETERLNKAIVHKVLVEVAARSGINLSEPSKQR